MSPNPMPGETLLRSPAVRSPAVREPELAAAMAVIGRRAREAAAGLALASAEAKSQALREAARAVRTRAAEILDANGQDLAAAGDLSPVLRDRLALDPKRIEAIAAGLEEIAALPDPVGRSLGRWTRPNGLDIERIAVPLGVIGIIYESRPNVTADAGGIALKSGNAAILRGGSESFYSSRALVAALAEGLHAARLPEAAIQLVPTRERAAVGLMLGMTGTIDIIVPRGGASLIERVQRESRIPVIAHLEGLCHTYIDRAADPEKARKIALNAKMRRVSICGATETLLVDRPAVGHLPAILADLRAAGCEVRGDPEVVGDRSGGGRRRTKRIGAPNISTRSSPCISSMASRRRSSISPAMARTIPTRSSPRTRRRPNGFCARSTAPSSSSTPRPSSPMAASSAWAPRSASRPSACRRAGRSGPSS